MILVYHGVFRYARQCGVIINILEMVETKRADRKQTKWPPRGHNGEINVHNFTGIEMDY